MTVEKKEMDSFVVNFYIQSGKRWINQNTFIGVNRTPGQMLAVMKALQ